MQDMIKRIIEMDAKAQEITKSAQQERIDSEKLIAESVQKLREDLLERARNRININRNNEIAILDRNWADAKKKYDRQMQTLEQMYEENGDAWASELAERAIGRTISVTEKAASDG